MDTHPKIKIRFIRTNYVESYVSEATVLVVEFHNKHGNTYYWVPEWHYLDIILKCAKFVENINNKAKGKKSGWWADVENDPDLV